MLERIFDFAGVGIFHRQCKQAHQRELRGLELLAQIERRPGEEIALKEVETERLAKLQLAGGFYVLREQLFVAGTQLADTRGECSSVGHRHIDRDDLGELDELRGRRLAVSRVVGGAVVVHGQRETLVDELAAAFQNFVRRREAGFELEHDERRRKRFDQLAQQEVAIDLDEGAIGTERLLARGRGKGLRERGVDVFAGTFADDHAVLQHERKCEQLLLAAQDRLAAKIKQRVRWIR